MQGADEVGPVVQQIKAALAEAGRTDYEPDHFGAGFAFHFGSWDDPDVQARIDGLRRRLPEVNPDKFFAIGGAAEIQQRIDEYRAAGVSKFILSPLARGDAAIMRQTQQLLDEVLPVVHADGG